MNDKKCKLCSKIHPMNVDICDVCGGVDFIPVINKPVVRKVETKKEIEEEKIVEKDKENEEEKINEKKNLRRKKDDSEPK